MKLRWLVTIAVLLAVVCSTVPSATAAQGRHCAIQLVPTAREGAKITARAELMGCFPTLAEALAAGSHGAITVDESTTPERLTEAAVTSVTPQTSVLIGTEFNRLSYGGGSNDYFAPTACSGTDVWEVNYVGDAWNDYFSSGKGFGGCDHNKKFEAADFGGNVVTCTPSCGDYGVVSNLVSSLRWRP